MSKEQIKFDLRKQVGLKLNQWAKDMFALYDMADLSAKDSLAAIATETSLLLTTILAKTTDMTPEEFGRFMTKTFAKQREETQEIEIELLHPRARPEVLGILPNFLDANDPRPVREQFDERYAHGGGWHPMKGWELRYDNFLCYQGEAPLQPLAQMKLRNELIILYDHAWVAIIQPDRTFEVSRMD